MSKNSDRVPAFRYCFRYELTTRGRCRRLMLQLGPSANAGVVKRGLRARMKTTSRHGLMPSGNAASASTVMSC